MPRYEFNCGSCEHVAHELRSIDKRDEPLECSKCGSTMVRVTANMTSTHFKGQGWTPKYHGQKEFRPK